MKNKRTLQVEHVQACLSRTLDFHRAIADARKSLSYLEFTGPSGITRKTKALNAKKVKIEREKTMALRRQQDALDRVSRRGKSQKKEAK